MSSEIVLYQPNDLAERIEARLEDDTISLQIQSAEIPNQGVFFDGQVIDAFELACRIIRSARKSIVPFKDSIKTQFLPFLKQFSYA